MNTIQSPQTPGSPHSGLRAGISLNTHPSSLNLILTRTRVLGEYCHGRLSIDGNHICDTLENTDSRVPAGKYNLTLIKCKQYSRKMPLLFPHSGPHPALDAGSPESHLEPETWNLKLRCAECKRLSLVCSNSTLPCYCPMIKPGNGVCNRPDGSILVGEYNCLGCLIHPKTTFDPLYERIRKSISRGNQVTLIIKDG